LSPSKPFIGSSACQEAKINGTNSIVLTEDSPRWSSILLKDWYYVRHYVIEIIPKKFIITHSMKRRPPLRVHDLSSSLYPTA